MTALVVLPAGLYGWIAVSESRAALAHAIGLQLAREARNTAAQLASAIDGRRDALASFAGQDVMREIRIGDLDKRISSSLASLKSSWADCLDLLVVDHAGTVVAATDPSRLGRAGPGDDGTHLGGPRIEGPDAVADGARHVLRIVVPIPDPDDARSALGRLVALVDWEQLTDMTARVHADLTATGVDADVLVVDPDGIVIGGAPRRDGRWHLGDAFAVGTRHDAGPAPGARVAREARTLLGYAALSDDLPRWTIVVAQPFSEAFAPVRRMARLLAAVLAATFVGALALALVAARRVSQPLEELTQAAQEAGRGVASIPMVPVRSHDEIGTLAGAFNRMAADLARAEGRLVEAAKFAFAGELAAGVAHEVRTPLGVLRSSTQLLERSLDRRDEETGELLRLMRDEVDRIERVVSGLLELARPRELRLETVHLGPIVVRATDFIEVQARSKGVAITRRPHHPDPTVSCDPELTYQVALNLLVNAVQILDAGSEIEVAVLPPNGGYAGFEIRDDGPGIPPEIRDTVFQPFVTGRTGGTGLGLTFVQRVVLEHHGRVTVADNERGRGTVFRIELPAREHAA